MVPMFDLWWAEYSRRLCSRGSLLCSGCFLVRPAFSLGRLVFLLTQHRPQALYVSCHHRHGNVALETIDAVIGTFVQAVEFEGVDGRFHRRMLFAQFDKFRLAFPRLSACESLPPSWAELHTPNAISMLLDYRGMKAFVHADCS